MELVLTLNPPGGCLRGSSPLEQESQEQDSLLEHAIIRVLLTSEIPDKLEAAVTVEWQDR